MNSNQAKQTWNFYLVSMKVASIIATNERDSNTTVMENALAISLKLYCILRPTMTFPDFKIF